MRALPRRNRSTRESRVDAANNSTARSSGGVAQRLAQIETHLAALRHDLDAQNQRLMALQAQLDYLEARRSH